jgi:hypothetical protein
VDIIYPVMSDDGTLPEDSAMYKWSVMLLKGFTANGCPIDGALHYKEQLAQAGFVGINIVKRKWPTNR